MKPLDSTDRNQCQECGEKIGFLATNLRKVGIDIHECPEPEPSDIIASDPAGFDPLSADYCPVCAGEGMGVPLETKTEDGVTCEFCPKCNFEAVCA